MSTMSVEDAILRTVMTFNVIKFLIADHIIIDMLFIKAGMMG